MKFSETVQRVIDLATSIRDYWESELPKRHPTYPVVPAGEDSGPPPAEENQLRAFLDGLTADEIHKLLLIMYLGRGDFGTDQLESNLKTIKERFVKPESAISQMSSNAPLADYLSDGLEALKEHNIPVDALTTKLPKSPAKSRA